MASENDVMTEPQHHPFGPSQIEGYDPKSGGCYARTPAQTYDFSAALDGTLRHLASASGDMSVLEGDPEAEEQVQKARDYIRFIRARMDGEEFHEIRLNLGHINYGTADYIRLNSGETQGLIVDLKFGFWGVTPAKANLQLLNYVCALMYMRPKVRRVLGVIYHVRSGTATQHWFSRRYYQKYFDRIQTVVTNAVRAHEKPESKDFTPNAVTCQFCARIQCPARIQLASALVNVWQKEPVSLPQGLLLTRLDIDSLGSLKRLTGALKAFCTAVDAESKRRAIDEGILIPGYELRERSGPRTIVGSNISLALTVISETWVRLYPSIDLPINDILMGLVEVSMLDLEKHIARHAPRGAALKTQKLISDALEEAKLVQSMPQWILAAVRQ
jgi:Protein of unknown function (DUF2800)